MATLTEVAARYITVKNGAVSERSAWTVSSGYCGYRTDTTKSTIQLRAYLSEPCTSLTLKITPQSLYEYDTYYFKTSTLEQDSTLEIASANVESTPYDVKHSSRKYAYTTFSVTINGNFKAGYIYVYCWAAATNTWGLNNSSYPSKIDSATSATAYTLSISAGANSTIAVSRSSSNLASTGTLSNGAKIYSGDKLKVTFSASTGYNVGTHTVNGSTFTSGNTHTVSGNVSVVSSATVKSFKLTISAGANGTTTVKRTSSPKQGASTGNLSNGATIYYSDVLQVTITPNSSYTLETATLNGSTISSGATHTVTAAVSVVTTFKISAGIVGIYNGSDWDKYFVYIYNGSDWDLYSPYVYNGSSWDLCIM